MAAHGTRSRYREGCRCTTCKEAQSAYYRRWRDAGGGGGGGASAVSEPFKASGPVEAATEAQLAALSGAQAQPALAQAALSMARLLDSDRAPASHPMAAGKLADLLDRLRKGSDLRKSGLASVRAMSRGDRPGSATG